MSDLTSSLGGSGAVGAAGGQYSSEAKSGVGEFINKATQGNGGGNRGFQNFVSFEGSNQSVDAGINDPVTKNASRVWLIIGGLAVLLVAWKVIKH